MNEIDLQVVQNEKDYRYNLWEELKKRGGPQKVASSVIRELGIYGGQQGIFVNKSRTREVSQLGITLSVLHTGRHYVDELSETDMIYHYPNTNRLGHDISEINATKEASRLDIPIFVIVEQAGGLRDVYLSWIIDWDDTARQFLIEFSDERQSSTSELIESVPFEPFDTEPQGTNIAKARPKQPKFKFQIIKRYGAQCVFCGIDLLEVLDAVHIIGKASQGADDPRNGLLLCANHHRMLDRGLIGINPNTLKLQTKQGLSLEALGVQNRSLHHLSQPPDTYALSWLWEEMKWNG